MTSEQKVESARQSWTNARSSRLSAEAQLLLLNADLTEAQFRVTKQEQLIHAAVTREASAKQFFTQAERENTAEAKAAQAARVVAEQVIELQQRAAAAQAAKERALAEELVTSAALSAFIAQTNGQAG